MGDRSVTWTPEMVAALHTLREQGEPLTRCADRLGVSYKLTVMQARKLGLNGRERGIEAAARRRTIERRILTPGRKFTT